MILTFVLHVLAAFSGEFDKAYKNLKAPGTDVKKVDKMLLPVPLSGITKSSLEEYDPDHLQKATEKDIMVQFDRAGNQRPYFFSVYKITNPANPSEVSEIINK